MEIAIVTGGSKGIGKSIAEKFASKGKRVLVVARTPGELLEVQKQYKELVEFVAADISTKEGRAKVFAAIPELCYVNILVNNAATLGPIKPLDEVKEEERKEVFNLNVDAQIELTKLLLPKICKGGRILDVSSGLDHIVLPLLSTYAMSKAAFRSYSEHAKSEFFKKYGIYVGTLNPSVVDTPMQHALRAGLKKIAEERPEFQEIYKLVNSGTMQSPNKIADLIYNLLYLIPATKFSEKYWDFDLEKDIEYLQNYSPEDFLNSAASLKVFH